MSELEAIVAAEVRTKMSAGVLLADAYFSVGYCARLDWDYPKAIYALSKAIAIHPENALYLQALGIAYADSNENGKAVECFRACLSLECRGLTVELEEENPYFHMGWCLEDLGRLDEAEQVYREGLKNVPSHYQGFLRLGQLLQCRLKFDEAVAVYESGIGSCEMHNPKALGRIVMRDIRHNLDRARRELGYETYAPTPEEKRLDVELMSEGIR
jgi:tetratricopeptide (TPR) repeat protein